MDKIQEFLNNYGIMIALLGVLGIEISPIKINPLKWFFKKINNIVFGSINEQLDKINKRLDKIETNDDFTDVMNIKTGLTQFHTRLTENGLREEEYHRCFELIDRYEYYHLKYPDKVNGQLKAIKEAIEENYKKGNIKK